MSGSLPMPEFDQLTVSQRLDLISLLWDSLSESVEELPVPEWHKEELERRMAEADATPESGIPWEQVRSELRGTS
jgi:putative addiction module component (TIGR02574 family)